MNGQTNRNRLILALDGPGPQDSIALLESLRGVVGACKVGPALFAAGGEPLLQRIGRLGFGVFLDLKFHDIPQTVYRAVHRVARPPVRFLTVHALGGGEMLRRAAQAAADAAADSGGERTAVLAVTLLTSHSAADLEPIGLTGDLSGTVSGLARLARDSGLDGTVCSGREAARVRSACGAGFLILTPGIRPTGSPADDQARTATPAEAIGRGADYLVVGRPILNAADPKQAAAAILAEIDAALSRAG